MPTLVVAVFIYAFSHPIASLSLSLTSVFYYKQDFFEGVEERLAAGVKADEVGYQLAFSKQELRKCIKEYPAKEVV